MVNSYYYSGNEYIPRSENDKLKGFVLSTMASSAIMGTLPLFSKPFSRQLVKEHAQNYLYKDAFEKSLDISGLKEKGVTIVPAQNLKTLSDEACGLNAFYQPATKKVVINTDKISIAGFHELGHAMNDITGKAGKFLSKLRWPARGAAGYLGYIAMFSRTKPKEAPKDKIDFLKDNCGKLAFACLLPTVLEEGMASYKGLKLARQCGLSDKLVKNMKKMYGKALFTYIGQAIATGLAVGTASIVMDHFTRPKNIGNDDFFSL